MNSLAISNLGFDTPTTSEHEMFSRSDPNLRPFEVQAYEMIRTDEIIDAIAFNKDQQEKIIAISIKGLLTTTEPFTITVPLSLPFMTPLILRTDFLRSVRELPTTELFPITTSLTEYLNAHSNIFTIDLHRDVIGISFDEDSPPETIKSSLDEDFVISNEDLAQFHNNLDDPEPERVRVREKTLARAIKVFEKYKDNI